jgi:hypothetical protein
MKIIDDNNPSIQKGMIEQLEVTIQHPLPPSYRKFLETHNGGRPRPNFFHIAKCQSDAIVDHLLGLGREGEDLIDWLDELDDLHGQFIAIGFDPGGNALILDYLSGEVYYWDSARHFDSSTDEENSYLIADSFENFIAGLKPPTESSPAN